MVSKVSLVALIVLHVSLCMGGTLLEYGRCSLDPSLLPLAAKNVTVESILSAPARPRRCPTPTIERKETRLIYVTPWNRDGYAYTSLHAQEITHVAPVWYTIQVRGSSITLEGAHDVNEEWLSSMPEGTKIVPRFEINFASKKEIEAILFFPQKEAETIVGKIVEEVKNRKYDGVTLELPYPGQMKSLVQQLGTALHALTKELVLVIPAHHSLDQRTPFARSDLLAVEQSVDFFSLNAYDHAGAIGQESANAPIQWTRSILDELLSNASDLDDAEDDDVFGQDTLETESRQIGQTLNSKILLGLNFYGYTFTKDGVMNSITAKEYIGLLEFSAMSIPLEIQWDKEQAEHRMDGKIWSIWYPTVLSLLYRVELAREYGVGISVWEAGQGLESFWDVLL